MYVDKTTFINKKTTKILLDDNYSSKKLRHWKGERGLQQGTKKIKITYNPKGRELKTVEHAPQETKDDKKSRIKKGQKEATDRKFDVDTKENMKSKRKLSKIKDADDSKSGNDGKKTNSRKKQKLSPVIKDADTTKDDKEKGRPKKLKLKKPKRGIKGTKEKHDGMAENGGKWCSIKSRSSPRQFKLLLDKLTAVHRDTIRKMGFEKLLTIQMDGIPEKIGHYVVDKLNTETMELEVGTHRIQVDDESISQLLGIPNGGIDLESFTFYKKFEGVGKRWKDMYASSYISPSEVTEIIVNNGDDVGIMFKLNFLMMFISSFVEIQDQGKCNLNIIHYMNDEVDLGEINWCLYIVNSIKKCKNTWKRCDKGCYFTCTLSILVLLYVDRINIEPINVIRETNPLQFWTVDRLQSREKLELKNGGFGDGELRELYVDVNQFSSNVNKKEVLLQISRITNEIIPDDLTGHVENIDKLFEKASTCKKMLEAALCDAYSKFPSIQEIGCFINTYEAMNQRINILLMSGNLRIKKQEKKRKHDSEPSFKLLSSQESDDKFKNAKVVGNVEQEQVETENEASNDMYLNQPVGIDVQMTPDENTVCSYLMLISKDKKMAEQKTDVPTKVSYKQHKGVITIMENEDHNPTKEELEASELAAEMDEVERLFLKEVFVTSYGLHTKAFLLTNLGPGKQVYNSVIDCWTAVLNYQEQFRAPGSLKRLFCYTQTISDVMLKLITSTENRLDQFGKRLLAVLEGCKEKLDLKLYDIIVFPVLEHRHYYLVCFDLTVPTIEVIDNMSKRHSCVTIKDNPRFAAKSTPYKIKHIVATYMHKIKHPVAGFLARAVVFRKKH